MGWGGAKKWKSRPLYQTQPEVYGKVKWMATSERVNLFTMYPYKKFYKENFNVEQRFGWNGSCDRSDVNRFSMAVIRETFIGRQKDAFFKL